MSGIQSYTNSKGKFYKFQIYVGTDPITGKRIKTTRSGFSTQKEASLAKSSLLLDIEKNGFKKQTFDTYQHVYDVWIKNYENTVKESTFVKTQRSFKNHILPYFSEMRIEKIDILTCQKFINTLFKKLKKFKMTFNYASLIFDYALTLGLIDRNPCKGITVPVQIAAIVDEKKKMFYDKDELNHFLACMEKENNFKAFTLMRLLSFSGMRKGEALALTYNDLNFKDNTIRINKALTRGKDSKLIIQTPKTQNSVRTIDMDKETMGILKQWRTIQKKEYMVLGYNTLSKDQLIFSNYKNTYLQPGKTRKWLLACQNKYGLKKITTHHLRHSHISILLEAGIPLKVVQERVGHAYSSSITLDVYAHASDKAKKDSAIKFADFMEA